MYSSRFSPFSLYSCVQVTFRPLSVRVGKMKEMQKCFKIVAIVLVAKSHLILQKSMENSFLTWALWTRSWTVTFWRLSPSSLSKQRSIYNFTVPTSPTTFSFCKQDVRGENSHLFKMGLQKPVAMSIYDLCASWPALACFLMYFLSEKNTRRQHHCSVFIWTLCWNWCRTGTFGDISGIHI